MRIACIVVGVLACASAPAGANPLELLGLTSRHAAQANAGVAAADDAAALYYDPAGLAVEPAREMSVGFVGAYAKFHPAQPFGMQIALRAPAPLRGDLGRRIVVGVALHLLGKHIARVVAPAPEEAYYAYWDRLARIVVLPGIGVRVTDTLYAGASVDVLAGLSGQIAASEGITRAIDARVDERIGTIARIIAGAIWRPSRAWRFGAVYRQRFEVPFQTAARTIVGGEPIDLDLRATGLFSPHTLVVGTAWTSARGTLAIDLGYARWSDYPGPYVQVDARLPLVGAIAGEPPKLAYRDTVAARVGFETPSCTCGWIARAGYAFETSPIPAAQPGVSNLLDGPHHTISFGGGRAFGRWRIDAHVALSIIGSRTITKALFGGGEYDPATTLRDEDPSTSGLQISNPGYPSIETGARVVSGGLTAEVSL